MKIRCVANNGKVLSRVSGTLGDSCETKYPIEIGAVYNVYGQQIFKGTLSYLIIGTYENLPSWYPVELFEVVDSLLPYEWYYKFYGYDDLVNAVWGYKELVLVESHHDELIEREDEAIRIFLSRKKEIDEYFE